MAEFATFHTARKARQCEGAYVGCVHNIARGDRYCKSAMAPGGEYGGAAWEHMVLCVPCANGYGHVDPAMVDVSAVPR
jgi:hypothetical protein